MCILINTYAGGSTFWYASIWFYDSWWFLAVLTELDYSKLHHPHHPPPPLNVPVLQCVNDATATLMFASHHHRLHLHLRYGGQQERHCHTEQCQLRGQWGTRGCLLLLPMQELQPTLELHGLTNTKRRGRRRPWAKSPEAWILYHFETVSSHTIL